MGHGFINTMSVGVGGQTLVNSDAASFTNGNETFFLYAINCTSCAIDFNCIGEEFQKNPNGGSVAVVGSAPTPRSNSDRELETIGAPPLNPAPRRTVVCCRRDSTGLEPGTGR